MIIPQLRTADVDWDLHNVALRAVLQIQDWSPESRPVAWHNWVQCCTLYGNATHKQYKVQNHAGQKRGELGPHQLQSNKVSDSINYHFI